MTTSRFALVAAIMIWICGGLQQGVAVNLSMLGAQPDYLFVLVCVLGLLTDVRSAVVIGFFAGFVESAIIGTHMWQLVLTRTIACCISAYLVESRFQRNFATASVVTAATTLICGVLFMIIALQSNIGSALKATIITALYNGVLALVAYVPLERATGAKSQQL